MTDRDQLREKVAGALRDWDADGYDPIACDEFYEAQADAVLPVLPQYEQVGWMGERGLFFPADLTPAPHWVPVYIVREAEG